ncbi:MAG: hypothetical protein AAFS10_00790 [Myxococcota bacterium]
MNRRVLAWVTTVMIFAPSMAWAGGPNADSPEPSFWIFLLMGAIPAVWLVVRHNRQEAQKATVDLRRDP